MHLLIDNYGVKLEVEDGKFKISAGENIRYASALKLSSICILKHCEVTSAALELAATNEIPVMIVNETGDVTAWLWSPRYGTIANVRVNQAFFSKSKDAVVWMQKILKLKFDKQAQLLTWLSNRISAEKNLLQTRAAFVLEQKTGAEYIQTMAQLMGVEAIASKNYWNTIATALRKFGEIPGRIKRGARDPFNVSLNYLYGVLYGQVEVSLLMAGADPYMGFMHVNRHAKPALAFDHIEPFRPWVDKLVIQLFMQQSTDACLESIGEDSKKYLTSEWRRMLLNAYFQFMEQKSYLNGKRIKNEDHIHHLSRELVKTLKNYNHYEIADHPL